MKKLTNAKSEFGPITRSVSVSENCNGLYFTKEDNKITIEKDGEVIEFMNLGKFEKMLNQIGIKIK